VTVSRALKALLALALGAACAILVACGGGDAKSLIPGARADALVRELDQLDRAVRNGDCEAVDGSVAQLQEEVNGLGGGVDRQLRDRLQEGVANLAQIAPEECLAEEQDPATTETTETAPVETTETEPAPVETTETEPAPVETTETEPVEPVEPPVDPVEPPVETIPPDTGGTEVPTPDEGDTGDTGGATPTP
jgi:outer membrane biosynthesis protein TonB